MSQGGGGRNLILALLVAAMVAAWIGSGLLTENAVDEGSAGLNLSSDLIGSVGVRELRKQFHKPRIVLRAVTEADTSVELSANINAEVIRIAAQQGRWVKQGRVLCQLNPGGTVAQLEQAKAQLNQAGIEYKGQLQLRARNITSDIAVSRARAQLDTAKAALQLARYNYNRTQIRAPFSGIVDRVMVDAGDFLNQGKPCVKLIAPDPMLLVAHMPEVVVDRVSVGSTVVGELADGKRVAGTVRFVSREANVATRTFLLEVEVANPHASLRSGMTASIVIEGKSQQAHFIRPSALTLDDAGRLGVRLVDTTSAVPRVQFQRVSIIDDSADGIWVLGLPNPTLLIEIGQEYVKDGDSVKFIRIDQGAEAGS